ncbi:unnamed protein product [Allacma fusca]|uniref:aspartate carbamoyltransferase n=1 Tax=Allacma fusca TaxID=39272 RepID=A0A8J2JR34_9HEXA|nr:unnamed protein product [Allacma fusca]
MYVEPVEWTFENVGGEEDDHCKLMDLTASLAQRHLELVINLPMRSGGARRVSSFLTHGYRTRRLAVDYSVPLVTDVKCAKLLVEAILRIGRHSPKVKPHIDCITSRRTIRIPGLIDVHVHLREPGASYKEDFATGTAAALAGGFTMVCVMPNTQPAVIDKATLIVVKEIAKKNARCDYALFMGGTEKNFNEIPDLSSLVAGLKLYLNDTFTTLKMNDITMWGKHFEHWPLNVPLCVHAESKTCAAAILVACLHNRPVHICHVSLREEIELIKAAKLKGLPITCEVTPHHLFFTQQDLTWLGQQMGQVRPMLATEDDQNALWENLQVIDCFASDHAPHTKEEKRSDKPPPGFPGLETMLPLFLTAVNDGRLTLDDVVNRLYYNPKKIFNLPDQPNTYVEIDMETEWKVVEDNLFTKCKWSPFGGRTMKGSVCRVVLRGEVAYVDGQVLVPPGFGFDLRELQLRQPFQAPKDSHNSSLEGGRSTPMFGKTKELTVLCNPSDPFEFSAEFGGDIQDGRASMSPMIGRPSSRVNRSSLSPTITGSHNPLNLLATASILSPPVPGSTLMSLANGPSTQTSTMHFTSPARNLGPAVNPNIVKTLVGHHVLKVDSFTKDQLHCIFNLAQNYRFAVSKDRPLDHILRGKIMASIFYEASTRTSCSFAAAAQRLGAQVIYMDETSSSAKKGESLEDTMVVMSGYSDVVVLRHPKPGAVGKAAAKCRKPIINAGDGVGEHPTQALLDIFTIREEIGTVNGLTVTFVGDLKHGRTVHSLARLLTLYKVHLRYVSPSGLEMPKDVRDFVASKGVQQTLYTTLNEALRDTDVLYVTRIQQERFTSAEEYNQACGQFVITPQIMSRAKLRMIVMHPLPRVFEISPEFDTDPRAAYFRQAESGMYVRMALLAIIMGRCGAKV